MPGGIGLGTVYGDVRVKTDALNSDASTIKSVFAGLRQAAANIMQGIAPLQPLVEDFAKVPNAANTAMSSARATIVQESATATNAAIDAFSAVATSANQGFAAARDAAQAAGSSIAGVFDGVVTGAERAGAAVRDTLGHVKDFAEGILDLTSKLYLSVLGIGAVKDAIAGLMNGLIGANATFEQQQIAFTGLLGSAKKAQSFLKELQQFAAATPFEFPDLVTASQKLLAFGFSANQVKPMLTAVGDAAAGLGASADQVNLMVYALGQMHAAGTVHTQDLMQLANVGVPVYQMLADGLHTTTANMKAMVEKGAVPSDKAIQILLAGMEKTFGGQMANQALTFNGLMSTLADNARFALMAFAGPLFERAKSSLQTLGNLVQSTGFQNFAKAAGELVGRALDKLIPLTTGLANGLRNLWSRVQELWPSIQTQLRPALERLLGAAQNFGTVFNGIGNLFGDVAYSVGQILGPALADLAPHFRDFQQALQPLLPMLDPFDSIIADIALHAGTAQQIWTLFTDANERIAPVLGVVIPLLGQVASLLMDGIGAAVRFVSPYLQQAAKGLQQFAGDILTRVGPALQSLVMGIAWAVGIIQTAWNAVWPTLAPIVHGVFDEIAGIIKIAWSLISGIIKIALDVLGGNWSLAWSDLKDTVGGVFDGIGTFLHGWWDALPGIFMAGIGQAVQMVLTSLDNLTGGMVSKLGNLKDQVLGIFGIGGGSGNGGSNAGSQQAAAAATAIQTQATQHAQQLAEQQQYYTKQASAYETQRQKLIQQLSQTTDAHKRAAIQMQIVQVTAEEETAKKKAAIAGKAHQAAIVQAQKAAAAAASASTTSLPGGNGDLKARIFGALGDLIHGNGGPLGQLKDAFASKLGEAKDLIASKLGEAKDAALAKLGSLKDAAVGKLQEMLDGARTALQAGLQKVLDIILAPIRRIGDFFDWLYHHNYVWQAIVDGARAKLKVLQTAVANVINGVKTWLGQRWTDIQNAAKAAWGFVHDHIVQPIQQAVQSVKDHISDAKTTIASTWTSIVNGVKSAWDNFKTAVQDGVSAVVLWISDNLLSKLQPELDLGKKFYDWATNAMNQFKQGIQDKIQEIEDVAGSVASSIAKKLGFHSPPPEGPLADSDEYMPNMMKMFGAGIAANRRHALDPILALANDMNIGLTGAIPTPGVGTTIAGYGQAAAATAANAARGAAGRGAVVINVPVTVALDQSDLNKKPVDLGTEFGQGVAQGINTALAANGY